VNQRGRKSAAALVVVDESKDGLAPIMPPPSLSPAERTVWLATVNSKPRDWFGTEHIPLLVEYVRHVSKAAFIDAQIKVCQESLGSDEDLDRYDRLLRLASKESQSIKVLATSMRLTQHSVYQKDKVIPKPGRRLWQREPSE